MGKTTKRINWKLTIVDYIQHVKTVLKKLFDYTPVYTYTFDPPLRPIIAFEIQDTDEQAVMFLDEEDID